MVYSNSQDALQSVFIDSLSIGEKMASATSEALLVYLKMVLYDTRNNDLLKGLSPETKKVLKSNINNIFDQRFRKQDFITSLSDTVASYSMLAKTTGFGQLYQSYSDFIAAWNNAYLEPIRDKLWRTPSHKVCSLEKYTLFRYDRSPNGLNSYYDKSSRDSRSSGSNDDDKSITTVQDPNPNTSPPLLMVYGFINRHYILDLVPEVSIVRSLLKHGFDIYATDWSTPSSYDKDLTLDHFVNRYMDKSVDLIREITKSDKISLFGYCWGGNLVLMYAALHPEKVRNIVTIATPGDFSADNTLLNLWTRNMKVDTLLDAFGNAPGELLNGAFSLRNPIEYIYKYQDFFERQQRQPEALESELEFFATETWLYDSPPIIGEIYREFVKHCYQGNLFIKNKMTVNGSIVDLGRITAPFLNVIAQKDDLVAPSSSNALNNVVGSKDKTMVEYPSGHVGLIIGHRAHKEIWPKVGNWLRDRS